MSTDPGTTTTTTVAVIPPVSLDGTWSFSGVATAVCGCPGLTTPAALSIVISQSGTSLTAVVSGYGGSLDYSGQLTTSGFRLDRDYSYGASGLRCRAHASVEAFGYTGEIPATVSASTRCTNGARCSGTYVGTMILEEE